MFTWYLIPYAHHKLRVQSLILVGFTYNNMCVCLHVLSDQIAINPEHEVGGSVLTSWFLKLQQILLYM